MSNEKVKPTKICGLWRKTVNGKEILTGNDDKLNYTVWINDYKGDDDKKPDFVLYTKPKYVKPPSEQLFPVEQPAMPSDEIPF